MKKNIVGFCGVIGAGWIAAISLCGCCAEKAVSKDSGCSSSVGAAASAANGGVVRLFNGRNLDGWYTWLKGSGKNSDPKGIFTVNDGILRVSGEDFGGITSDEEFENFEAVVEFKWSAKKTCGSKTGKARDSGFLFASNGADGGFSVWMPSLEVNIMEGRIGDFWVVAKKGEGFSISSTVKDVGNFKVYNPDGTAYELDCNRAGAICRIGIDPDWKDVTGAPDKSGIEKPCGEWNTLVLSVNKGVVEVRLNGTLVNKSSNFSPRKGRIQIQSEGAEVFYRKIDIKKL